MRHVIFRNKGVIDPLAITSFGVSAKVGDNPIGFFGTGLKYALAILLREGCKVTIYSGREEYEFGTEADTIRGESFEFVTMNRQILGFTTQVGKNWKMWQAFRELYCNALDEGGDAEAVDYVPDPDPEGTMVVVSGQPFLDVWADRREIILATDPIQVHEAVGIHPNQSKFVYYRGVRVYELQHPTLFTYNVLGRLELTEDRTAKWHWDIERAIRYGVMETTDRDIATAVAMAPEGTHEHGMDFTGVVPSDTMREVVGELARSFTPGLNQRLWAACRPYLLDAVTTSKPAQLDAVERKRMAKAVDFCRVLGFGVEEFPIVVTDFLGEGVLGQAHNNTIYISRRALMMGTKMLTGTLVEEYIHLKYKLHDETRSMQNFLFDTIVSLGERLTGEPL